MKFIILLLLLGISSLIIVNYAYADGVIPWNPTEADDYEFDIQIWDMFQIKPSLQLKN